MQRFSFVIAFVREFTRRLTYFAVVALAISALIYIGQYSYYALTPGSWFFDVKSATISSAPVSQPINLTLCRRVRYPNIDENTTVRSFFLIAGSKHTVAGVYKPKPNYEGGEQCQIVEIAAKNHPSKAGTYYAHTSVKFDVVFDGKSFEKTINYDTTTFRLTDTVESLQAQIEVLQAQIRILQQLLRERGVIVPVTDNIQTVQQGVDQTQQLNNQFQNSTPQSSAPSTQSPVVPTTPANQNFTGALVDGTLKLVQDTSNGILQGTRETVRSIL